MRPNDLATVGVTATEWSSQDRCQDHLPRTRLQARAGSSSRGLLLLAPCEASSEKLALSQPYGSRKGREGHCWAQGHPHVREGRWQQRGKMRFPG